MNCNSKCVRVIGKWAEGLFSKEEYYSTITNTINNIFTITYTSLIASLSFYISSPHITTTSSASHTRVSIPFTEWLQRSCSRTLAGRLSKRSSGDPQLVLASTCPRPSDLHPHCETGVYGLGTWRKTDRGRKTDRWMNRQIDRWGAS